METTIEPVTAKDKQQRYETVIPQIISLIQNESDRIANLCNVTAVLKQSFPEFSWVGFYFIDEINPAELVLGPFQGKVACTRIALGKGVCGSAAEKKETIIVNDVAKFPGHIYCDADSKSEIVVPLFSNSDLKGVLDIDSHDYSTFDQTDKIFLEHLTQNISRLY